MYGKKSSHGLAKMSSHTKSKKGVHCFRTCIVFLFTANIWRYRIIKFFNLHTPVQAEQPIPLCKLKIFGKHDVKKRYEAITKYFFRKAKPMTGKYTNQLTF